MKYALVNPRWSFEGSVYFGCREPHLPLEYGYAKALLEREGHEAVIVDGQLDQLSNEEIKARLRSFAPDILVVTTAPSYLFWRCAPPELRIPQQLIRDLDRPNFATVIVGPHASTTPAATLRKLEADIAVLGECEEVLPFLNDSICSLDPGKPRIQGTNHASDMAALPALRWPDDTVRRHGHHHHRFDAAPQGPGAEMEVSRGCPYHCTFCAKDNFRDAYRKRPLAVILAELDGLLGQGIEYVYFIDEIFLPNRELLEALAEREIKFGMQTRIDLWNPEMLELLGRAGCVSIEAGIESISESGRFVLDKGCRLSTEELTNRLIHARKVVPFVQGNLLQMEQDDAEAVEAWRRRLLDEGVWANKPVPLFPYPGSPEYTIRWGALDDRAWERAHEHYLRSFASFSDVQDDRPLPLAEMELPT
jgi:B12-binding domain/radical SAM domain protein of rhizo-twelve system